MLAKLKNMRKIYRERGFRAVIYVLKTYYGLPIPLSAKFVWQAGILSELQFWDDWFRTKNSNRLETYGVRFNPDFPLQSIVGELLPHQTDIHILDVGAGPLTNLGKKWPGKQIRITAIDPLADQYDLILQKYGIQPLVRTENQDAENLTQKYPPNTFDLAYASNSIDHTYNPEQAILQMIEVVKPGNYVLLQHVMNEAENQNYYGLHQWNLSISPQGDFIISSKSGQVNMTQKYADRCTITCELSSDGKLNTRIQKKASTEA